MAAICRLACHITELLLQRGKAKKNGNYLNKIRNKKQSEDPLLLIMSQAHWWSGCHLRPWAWGPRTSVGRSTICQLHFSDHFCVYASELDSDWLLCKLAPLKKHSLSFKQTRWKSSGRKKTGQKNANIISSKLFLEALDGALSTFRAALQSA